jgi:hypothetical protein
MSEHDQQVSGVEATANPAPSKGRRRLVKGMIIGTPAILMVRNGYSRPLASFSGTAYNQEAIPRICESLGWTGNFGMDEKTNSLTSFYGGDTNVTAQTLIDEYGSNVCDNPH